MDEVLGLNLSTKKVKRKGGRRGIERERERERD
jgi:hypothetical protein